MFRVWSTVGIIISCASVSLTLYLINDYFMTDSWPKSFNQACDSSVEDDSLYVNSHLNSLGILNYGNDISCSLQLNSGDQTGSRYKLTFKRFDLEYSDKCSSDSLTIYDTELGKADTTAPFRKFCGSSEPNLTGFPTQKYITLKFKTDGSTGKKGFRILATRTLPPPCSSDYFLCKAENRCIDARLHCDGTPHCDDKTDEDGCSTWEKIIGGLLALGVSGIVGVVILVVLGCTGIGVTICVCTCCKKSCGKCCCKQCKGNKVGANHSDLQDLVEMEPESKVSKQEHVDAGPPQAVIVGVDRPND